MFLNDVICFHLPTCLGINLKELDSRYSSQKDFLHKVFPWYGEAYDYESRQTISVLSPVFWNTHLFFVCILVQAQWKSHAAPSRSGGPSLKKSAEYPDAFAAFVMRNHMATWWSRGVLGTTSGCLNTRCPFFAWKCLSWRQKRAPHFFDISKWFSEIIPGSCGVPPIQNRQCPLNNFTCFPGYYLLMLSLRLKSSLEKPLENQIIKWKGVSNVNGIPYFSLPSRLVYTEDMCRCF